MSNNFNVGDRVLIIGYGGSRHGSKYYDAFVGHSGTVIDNDGVYIRVKVDNHEEIMNNILDGVHPHGFLFAECEIEHLVEKEKEEIIGSYRFVALLKSEVWMNHNVHFDDVGENQIPTKKEISSALVKIAKSDAFIFVDAKTDLGVCIYMDQVSHFTLGVERN